ncbi:nucleic acid-binding protein, partial [Aureobasidium melanogenum]
LSSIVQSLHGPSSVGRSLVRVLKDDSRGRVLFHSLHRLSATVHDSVVDSKLTTFITENQNSDTATTLVESISEALQQVALVNDGKTLLDIAGLGHGNNVAVIADVKNTVLLEHRVGDERRLFLQLLGEEVDTKVAMLSSLRRGSDTNDLAGAALKVQQVTDADVVARDRDGAARARAASGTTRSRHGDGLTFFNDFFNRLGVMVVLVVVTRSVDRVENVVSSTVKVDGSTSLRLDTYFLFGWRCVVVVSSRGSGGIVLNVRAGCVLGVGVLSYGVLSRTSILGLVGAKRGSNGTGRESGQREDMVGGELVHVTALVPEPPDPPARAEARKSDSHWRRMGDETLDLPVLFDTDLGLSVGTRRTLSFVDVDVLFSASWTTVVLLCNSDLLFEAAGRRFCEGITPIRGREDCKT